MYSNGLTSDRFGVILGGVGGVPGSPAPANRERAANATSDRARRLRRDMARTPGGGCGSGPAILKRSGGGVQSLPTGGGVYRRRADHTPRDGRTVLAVASGSGGVNQNHPGGCA